jgi:hypothetical protein
MTIEYRRLTIVAMANGKAEMENDIDPQAKTRRNSLDRIYRINKIYFHHRDTGGTEGSAGGGWRRRMTSGASPFSKQTTVSVKA